MIFRNELETGGGDPSRIHMRRCKRCKCTNYAKAVKHNAAGEVIRCSVCSQDPMTLAQACTGLLRGSARTDVCPKLLRQTR